MDNVTIARAIHVLAIVHWIGGVAFVTLVILPSIATLSEPARRLALFKQIEARFSVQAKISVPLAGLSGAYMAEQLGAWPRFLDPAHWWLGAMALVWTLFMAILFVVEPLLHDTFERRAAADPDGTFWLLQRAHWVLLAAGAVAAGAGVIGVHAFQG